MKKIIGLIFVIILIHVFSVDCNAVDDNTFSSIIKAWITNTKAPYDETTSKVIIGARMTTAYGIVINLMEKKLLSAWQIQTLEDLIIANVIMKTKLRTALILMSKFFNHLLLIPVIRNEVEKAIKIYNEKYWDESSTFFSHFEIIDRKGISKLWYGIGGGSTGTWIRPLWNPCTTFSALVVELNKLKKNFIELDEFQVLKPLIHPIIQYKHMVTYVYTNDLRTEGYWKPIKGGCILDISYYPPNKKNWDTIQVNPRAQYKLEWYIKNGGRLLVSIQTHNNKLGNKIIEIIKKYFEPFRMSEE